MSCNFCKDARNFAVAETGALLSVAQGYITLAILLGISGAVALGWTSVLGADANGNGGRPTKKK